MLKSPPKLGYSGLTIVLSNPSRFDDRELLSANGGWFFNNRCLQPELNRYQCEIRIADDKSPLLPNTRTVILAGESALKKWLPGVENSLNEVRGSLFTRDNITYIPSYFPQDCVDLKDYESEHNEQVLNNSNGEIYQSEDDKDSDASEDKRRHGYTKRRNFGFWLIQDCKKIKRILKHGPAETIIPEYVIYPSVDDIINLLTTTKNEYLDFDIETDCNFNILCFSFSFTTKTVYVVPTLLPDYSFAYSALHQIYRALAIAIRDNILVAHNGANFDFFVLAYKYRIPIYRVYDTMISHHRCFPEVEKSLGHCTSLWTNESFHKDEGDVPYNSLSNAKQVWNYCGKDVFTMGLIRQSINTYAKRNPGLEDSIQQANDSIKPYLIMQLMGIRYKQEAIDKLIDYNDRMCNQFLRWLNILIGADTLKLIRGHGKSAMPGSNPQCVEYFHNLLGYDVVGRGKERKDGTKGPSLGKENIFKLRLKVENPVLDIVIAYRELIKETGTLKFNPWKSNV